MKKIESREKSKYSAYLVDSILEINQKFVILCQLIHETCEKSGKSSEKLNSKVIKKLEEKKYESIK